MLLYIYLILIIHLNIVFVTVESAGWNDSIEDLVGEQGGGVHTVAEANDGIELLWESSSNFASGSKIILYALKK